MVPTEWRIMALVKLATLAFVAIASGVVPDWRIAIAAGAAIAIDAAAGRFHRFELSASRAIWLRLALLGVAVALPMLLYGAALATWAHGSTALAWGPALAALALVALVASVLLAQRGGAVLAAQAAMWAGVALADSRSGGYAVLAIGLSFAAVAFVRQSATEQTLAAHAAAERRVHDRAQEILAQYEETGQGWFWELDREGRLTYLSRHAAGVVGCRVEELLGQPLTRLFDFSSRATEECERALAFHRSARSPFADLAMRAVGADGEERWWSITGRPRFDALNKFHGFLGSGTDLTEKRRSQEHASRLAHYDSLTGLANRFQMSQTLEKILTAAHLPNRCCSVLLLDLDRFKQVNDTMGHPAGDALLRQVAERLERAVGAMGLVGRLGGDEFEVIVPGKVEREQLGHLAAEVIVALSQPYAIDDHRVTIGASVGIAIAPDDGITSEALIRNADLALYAAKDRGRGRHHFYAPDLHSDADERRQMEQDLRDAIVSGGLELHYQPVVQTATEKITGFEALLRWTHPTKGPVSPALFIPIAEEAGLIAQIGEWTLRTACRDLARWPEEVRVAVNVSALQFASPALPAIVTNALASVQIEPERLELEITESVFLNDDVGMDATFRALKTIGVRLALDDFGTGYSSLGYLKRAPFDKIKIDQSFVRGATVSGSRNAAIIAAIVSLAEALGMETTAEGVETIEELDVVRMLGCSHVQGYIYERPLNAVRARERLETGLLAVAQGPQVARAARETIRRRVVLEHDGQSYDARIRNLSQTGALIQGLWNVPRDTVFRVRLFDDLITTAAARWSTQDRMGVEFAEPLEPGRIAALAGLQQPEPTVELRPERTAEPLRRAS